MPGAGPLACPAGVDEQAGVLRLDGGRLDDGRSGTVETLTRRRDFVAANGGRRAPTTGFVLLVRERADGDPAMRVGFTVTKKIGNAVVRNRIKRRFRALAREILPVAGIAGADHVLVGRAEGQTRLYADMAADLRKALGRIAGGDPRTAPRTGPRSGPRPKSPRKPR